MMKQKQKEKQKNYSTLILFLLLLKCFIFEGDAWQKPPLIELNSIDLLANLLRFLFFFYVVVIRHKGRSIYSTGAAGAEKNTLRPMATEHTVMVS